MTDKEKLEKLKKLADAMYYAAQHLTTDASRLHKAMDEYHKFFIHECKEEPVSEDLDSFAIKYAQDKPYPVTVCQAVKVGANWQKEKDNEEKVLIYKHGFDDCKEQMMKDAISAKVTAIYYPTDSCLEIEATLPEDRFEDGDKVLIIKED